MTRSILSISTLVLGLVCMTVPGVAAAAPEDGTVSGGRVQATSNYTPYTPALICLAERNRATGRRAPRVSVGRIGDLTGRVDFDTGARVSQGASLFAITALARAGAPVVERLDNTVSQLELDYAQKHLLSDTPELAGQSAENFRPIFAGQVAGSDFFIVGGITELNYNIRSSGLNAQVGETAVTGLRGRAGLSDYVMNVAIDLRMVDSRSQIVVDTVSFQKQLVGREMNLGLSTGSDSVVGALSGGTQAVEPLQAAVRTLVERGVFELLAGLQAEGTYSGCLNENEAAS